MVASDIVNDSSPRRSIAYPRDATPLTAPAAEESAIEIDERVRRCFDAMRAETRGSYFDQVTLTSEFALLEGWLRGRGHGNAVSAQTRSLALYVSSLIRAGIPKEEVTRRVCFLRCFYAAMKQIGLRVDDPMEEVRIYGMFGGPSQRY